jgi:hypothetical protein
MKPMQCVVYVAAKPRHNSSFIQYPLPPAVIQSIQGLKNNIEALSSIIWELHKLVICMVAAELAYSFISV